MEGGALLHTMGQMAGFDLPKGLLGSTAPGRGREQPDGQPTPLELPSVRGVSCKGRN
jgi:hypothetical protein